MREPHHGQLSNHSEPFVMTNFLEQHRCVTPYDFERMIHSLPHTPVTQADTHAHPEHGAPAALPATGTYRTVYPTARCRDICSKAISGLYLSGAISISRFLEKMKFLKSCDTPMMVSAGPRHPSHRGDLTPEERLHSRGEICTPEERLHSRGEIALLHVAFPRFEASITISGDGK